MSFIVASAKLFALMISIADLTIAARFFADFRPRADGLASVADGMSACGFSLAKSLHSSRGHAAALACRRYQTNTQYSNLN